MATVPPQLSVQELGILKLWPMSSSYPAPTGPLETQTFLKTLALGKKETEVVLEDKIEARVESRSFIERFIFYINPNVNKNPTKGQDIVDFDGRAEDLLRPQLEKWITLNIPLDC